MLTNLTLLVGLGGLAGVALAIERWLARTELDAINYEYEILCEQMSDVLTDND